MYTKGLLIPLGCRLLYQIKNGVFEIQPRHVRDVYRNGQGATFYDLVLLDEVQEKTVFDYGTYFSVEDAINKIKSLMNNRRKTSYENDEGL